MTVASIPALVEYEGNGIITLFTYPFDLLIDSVVAARIDEIETSAFDSSTFGYVVFNAPPELGAKVEIYRRTKIWMPEDYKPMGRFRGEKTEESMDRIIMILQESAGIGRGTGNLGNGIVGSADIWAEQHEFDITVVSERGTDAVIPLWNPLGTAPPIPPTPPDPSILFAGETVVGTRVSASSGANIAAYFYKDWLMSFNQPSNEASAFVQYRTPERGSWLDTANPVLQPNQYWARLREVSIGGDLVGTAPDGSAITLDVPFDAVGVGGFWSVVMTIPVGAMPPFTYVAEFFIDICPDDGMGAPDGNWAINHITWTLDYTA